MEPVTFPIYVKDHTGVNFELSAKTAKKIEFHHGVRQPTDTVLEIMQNPDCIFESNWTADHHLYYKGFNGNKFYIVVVADLTEKRVDTAYVTMKVKKGKLIWPNS